jgi:hypothetical protein
MNIWWCNQSRDWEFERIEECVCASDGMERLTYRATVGEVAKGDLIVHYRKPKVVAFSKAMENGTYHRRLPKICGADYGSGWRFNTEYFDLEEPIDRKLFAPDLGRLATKAATGYAFNPSGAVKQGYFMRFDPKGLEVVLSHASDVLPKWLSAFAGEAKTGSKAATRREVLLNQLQRDRKIVLKLKNLYDNVCMLCGKVIKIPGGFRYSEAHHIRPLGGADKGSDTLDNLLCACPNCHTELDFGCRKIDLTKLAVSPKHRIAPENVDYHNRVICARRR